MAKEKKQVYWTLTVAVLAASLILAVTPSASAQENAFTCKLENMTNGTFSYALDVIIPETLTSYYQGLSHMAVGDSSFAKFVTPHAVKPIADAMRGIYPDDEDFANNVLTLVHQIPYTETLPEFYPVETISLNKGDCDMFSLLASSIMKAGGLDAVLLYYADEEHMNVGVHLAYQPQHARQGVYSVEAENVTYYVAECTGTNWQLGWRVGECPYDLQKATPRILTLENSEKSSPGQVMASIRSLIPSSTQLTAPIAFGVPGDTILLNGHLSPAYPNETVTLFLSAVGSSWTDAINTTTNSDGDFSCAWSSAFSGLITVHASWSGNSQCADSKSGTLMAIILPFYIVVLSAIALASIVILVIVYLVKRRSRRRQVLSRPEYTYEI